MRRRESTLLSVKERCGLPHPSAVPLGVSTKTAEPPSIECRHGSEDTCTSLSVAVTVRPLPGGPQAHEGSRSRRRGSGRATDAILHLHDRDTSSVGRGSAERISPSTSRFASILTNPRKEAVSAPSYNRYDVVGTTEAAARGGEAPVGHGRTGPKRPRRVLVSLPDAAGARALRNEDGRVRDWM